MNKLNEKRIEIPNPYPVKMEEIIDLVECSTRLIYTTTDSKTIQLYIYSTGRDRPDYLAEVEITSAGYILHDDDGFYYQGSTFKEFQNDLREVVFHFEAVVFKRLNESNDVPKITFKVKETFDSTSAAFNLTKLKGYLRFETRWEYDEGYPEDAMLVDKVHEPPRFTVNWIGPEGEKHPNTYCVRTLRDRGESRNWETRYFLKASDAAEMINLEVITWERNNESWRFN